MTEYMRIAPALVRVRFFTPDEEFLYESLFETSIAARSARLKFLKRSALGTMRIRHA